MRSASLTLATFLSLLGIPVIFVYGLVSLANDTDYLVPILLSMIIGIPVCIANAVVFDYVKRRMRAEGEFGSSPENSVKKQPKKLSSDVEGTPWAVNPGHEKTK